MVVEEIIEHYLELMDFFSYSQRDQNALKEMSKNLQDAGIGQVRIGVSGIIYIGLINT